MLPMGRKRAFPKIGCAMLRVFSVRWRNCLVRLLSIRNIFNQNGNYSPLLKLSRKKTQNLLCLLDHLKTMPIQILSPLAKKSQNCQQKTDPTCNICLQPIPPSQLAFLTCSHIFHIACIKNHIQVQVNEKKLKIACPEACGNVMKTDQIMEFIGEGIKEKYQKFCFDQFIEGNRQAMSWCPTPGCTAVFQFQKGQNYYHCQVCDKRYCLNCRVDYHSGKSCAQYRNSLKQSEQNKIFNQFALGNKLKKCPKCKLWVQKSQGCSTISCRCGQKFCYHCGGTTCPHGNCKNKGIVFQQRRQMIQQGLQNLHQYNDPNHNINENIPFWRTQKRKNQQQRQQPYNYNQNYPTIIRHARNQLRGQKKFANNQNFKQVNYVDILFQNAPKQNGTLIGQMNRRKGR